MAFIRQLSAYESSEWYRDFAAFVGTVEYKPGYEFVTEHMFTGQFRLEVRGRVECAELRDGTVVQIFFPQHIDARLWAAFGDLAKLRWVRKAILEFEQHELDEWIRWRGERVFDPHAEGENLIKGDVL